MSAPDIDPLTCPLCGKANACGMAAGRAECWCFAAVIPPTVLASIPVEAKDKACVCASCAGAEASTASSTPGATTD